MTPIFQCNQLTKLYGAFPALNSLSLTIMPGRIVGLLGPNGSGKSTLIKLANGLLTPTAGEVRINGMLPGPETKRIVSYLPERTYLSSWMKVTDAIDYFADFYEDFRPARAYEMLRSLQIDPKKTLNSMSKGTREKVQLILVMSRSARLYLLDEPIGGVDPAARDYILNTILSNYERGATILLSTHLIWEIEQILDDVVFIQNGQIALASSVADVHKNYGKSVDELFREVFRCW